MVFDLIGCDFSSSPTRRKPIMLALGQRQGARVQLGALQRFDTLAAFGQWLAQPGDWVGGFDLPFGLPRELVHTLGWPLQWLACSTTARSAVRKSATSSPRFAMRALWVASLPTGPPMDQRAPARR